MTFPIKSTFVSAAVVAGAIGLAACEQPVKAPFDVGICWHAIPMTDGTVKFNKLASDVPNMETCAAALESMRIRFARMSLSSSSREMMGAYQGNYLFIDSRGVSLASDMKKARYIALVRTGDGRLAVPGAIRRVIQAAEPDPATAN
jgi:outer membrane murein-binding lipoprotein Lpp